MARKLNPEITISKLGLQELLGVPAVVDSMEAYVDAPSEETLHKLASMLMIQGQRFKSIPRQLTYNSKGLDKLTSHEDQKLVWTLVKEARMRQTGVRTFTELKVGTASFTTLTNYCSLLQGIHEQFRSEFSSLTDKPYKLSKRDFYAKVISESTKTKKIAQRGRKWTVANLMDEEVIIAISPYLSDWLTYLTDERADQVREMARTFSRVFRFPSIDVGTNMTYYGKFRRAYDIIETHFSEQVKDVSTLIEPWMIAAAKSYHQVKNPKADINRQIASAIGFVCGKTYDDTNTAVSRFISMIETKRFNDTKQSKPKLSSSEW